MLLLAWWVCACLRYSAAACAILEVKCGRRKTGSYSYSFSSSEAEGDESVEED